jgi:hypothetical protein
VKKSLIYPLLGLSLCSLTLPLQAQPTDNYLTGQWALDQRPIAEVLQADVKTAYEETDIPDLYDRFAKHYARFMRHETKGEVDFEFIMGAQSSNTRFDLHYQLDRAIDGKFALPAFADFGIMSRDNQTYHVDLSTHPHLATPRDLFFVLFSIGDANFFTDELEARGMTKNDIATMTQYLQPFVMHYTTKQTRRAEAIILKTYLPKLINTVKLKAVLEPTLYKHQFDLIAYQNRYSRHRIWRNWGLQLLAQLEPSARRILQSFLIERLNRSSTISPSAPQENFLERIVNTDGGEEKLKNSLNEEIGEEL